MNHSQNTYLWIGVLSLFFLITPQTSYLQTVDNEIQLRNLRNYVEDKYQLDDLLVHGIIYRPNYNGIKGSPYFLNDRAWKSAKIFIKGRVFENQKVLYNIYTDEIIANITFPDAGTKDIVINHHFIDSINIESHFFINISPFVSGSANKLYEKIYDGSFKVLLKHHISYQGTITPESPNGYFEYPKMTLYILKQNNLVKITSKKILFKIFEPNKKQIAKYMRNTKTKLKVVNTDKLINLFKFCDDLSK